YRRVACESNRIEGRISWIDGDLPIDTWCLRRRHQRNHSNYSRDRRTSLYGRSKYERSSWINKSWKYWSRRLSLEFTQDFCDSTWWRWTRNGTNRCCEAPRSFLARFSLSQSGWRKGHSCSFCSDIWFSLDFVNLLRLHQDAW